MVDPVAGELEGEKESPETERSKVMSLESVEMF